MANCFLKQLKSLIVAPVLLTVLLKLGLSTAQAATPAVEHFFTEASVKREMCEQEHHFLTTGVCMISGQKTLKFYWPDSYAQIITKHIDEMEKRAYFKNMNSEDFFHGHLIAYGSQTAYASLDSYLNDIRAVLYHTDEYTNRWVKYNPHTPHSAKIPRSILGFMNGQILPAIQTIRNPSKLSSAYVDHGTIYSSDIAESRPDLSRLNYNLGVPDEVRILFSENDKIGPCVPNSMFYLQLKSDGRFQFKGGQRYEIFMYCELNEKVSSEN